MFKANKGKYVCEVLSDFTKTKSGIILARVSKEIPHRARVLSVGSPEIRTCKNCEDNISKISPCKTPKALCIKKNKLKKIVAKIGDIVHFKMKGGVKFKYDEKNYIVLTYNDILAKE